MGRVGSGCLPVLGACVLGGAARGLGGRGGRGGQRRTIEVAVGHLLRVAHAALAGEHDHVFPVC